MKNVINIQPLHKKKESKTYPYLTVKYDDEYGAAYYSMQATPVPSFTPKLLKSISDWYTDITNMIKYEDSHRIEFIVLSSTNPNIFNLGGDLSVIKKCILDDNREELFEYARACIDVLYKNITGLGLGLKTISLIQGNALGGGLEAALSSETIIAERGVKLGFPEALFNLFPGMGAYQLLARRVDIKQVKEIITSCHLYSAEEFYERGIIDILVEPGEGPAAVKDYIGNVKKRPNVHNFLDAMDVKKHEITYKELEDVIELWVDSAFNITEKNLKMMSALLSRQLHNNKS